MEALIAIAVGVLLASATYLLLSRNLLRLILGLVLIGNAANLTIFAGGRLTGSQPPLLGGDGGAMANALPQALILTAIVISFALIAFTMGLIYRAQATLETVDTDGMRIAEPANEPPAVPGTEEATPAPVRRPAQTPVPRPRRTAAGNAAGAAE